MEPLKSIAKREKEDLKSNDNASESADNAMKTEGEDAFEKSEEPATDLLGKYLVNLREISQRVRHYVWLKLWAWKLKNGNSPIAFDDNNRSR